MSRFLSNAAILSVLLCSCGSPKEKIPDTMPVKTDNRKVVVYQMMTRLFGNKVNANRTYGTLEENGCGKFNDVTTNALDAIKELGVTHIWYTGVIEHATLTDYSAYGIPLDDADIVKGRAGSPYAIKDYYDVDPDLAVNVRDRMGEFEHLIDRTHQQGLKAIIDFVPNHVARAYHSDAKPAGVRDLGEDDDTSVAFDTRNNFYYLPGESFLVPEGYTPLGNLPFPTKDGQFYEVPAKATGNDKFSARPDVNDWFETVKLNYGVDILNGRKAYFDPTPDTWTKMRDILLFWADKQVDGFRCDMAEMVPVEFWEWAIPQVKSRHPEIIFIAEIYNPAQYTNYIERGRFDFLYDKVQLYDTLRKIMMHQASTADITPVQKELSSINKHLLHFMENHDEQRLASSKFVGDPWRAVPAATISATIDKGPVMIYFGQEVGEPGQGVEGFGTDDGRTTCFDYWGVPNHQAWMNDGLFDGGRLEPGLKQLRKFYVDLLTMASDNQAIVQGDFVDLMGQQPPIDEQVFAFGRVFGDNRLMVISSFSETPKQIRMKLTPEAISQYGLSENKKYKLSDLLHPDLTMVLNEDLSFDLEVQSFSAHVFEITLQ